MLKLRLIFGFLMGLSIVFVISVDEKLGYVQLRTIGAQNASAGAEADVRKSGLGSEKAVGEPGAVDGQSDVVVGNKGVVDSDVGTEKVDVVGEDLGDVNAGDRVGDWGAFGEWLGDLLGRDYLPVGIALYCLFMLLTVPATREMNQLMKVRGVKVSPVIASLGVMGVFTCAYLGLGHGVFAIVVWGTFMGAMIWHVRKAEIEGALASGGATMLMLVYLGVLPSMIFLFRLEHAAWEVFGLLLVTKSCDIGAYFTGRMFGKTKLIPWLSPKKTIEGLTGGVLVSVCVALVYFKSLEGTFGLAYPVLEGDEIVVKSRVYSTGMIILFGVVFALVGHVGDLLMSLFKRDASSKDSGDSVPGFGGVMDVLDSILIVIPVAYWLLHWS